MKFECETRLFRVLVEFTCGGIETRPCPPEGKWGRQSRADYALRRELWKRTVEGIKSGEDKEEG